MAWRWCMYMRVHRMCMVNVVHISSPITVKSWSPNTHAMHVSMSQTVNMRCRHIRMECPCRVADEFKLYFLHLTHSLFTHTHRSSSSYYVIFKTVVLWCHMCVHRGPGSTQRCIDNRSWNVHFFRALPHTFVVFGQSLSLNRCHSARCIFVVALASVHSVCLFETTNTR